MVDTKSLRALLSRATPGPWEAFSETTIYGREQQIYGRFGEGRLGSLCFKNQDEDAQAIVAVMNAIGPLLAEVEAARACIEEIRRISGPTRIVVRDAIAAYDAATKGEP